VTAIDDKPIILVIDDEPGVRNVLDALLTYDGYRPYLAADGEQGLALAAQLQPDVILLDVMMPKLDGYEVCRRLRADPVLREVTILMITALSAREAKLDGINAGADDFINKPIDSMELRARLRTITRLNRYRRLLNEQRRFSWIVERSLDGYVALNQQGKLLFANHQSCIYLGVTNDASLAKQDFLELARRQYHCEPEAAWQGWPEQASPDLPRYLVRPETPTAQPFWLQVERLDLELGVEKQVICLLRDITAQKALQSNSATFNAFVSHKLRTPLSSIVSSIDVIRLSIATRDYQGLAEMAEYALQGAKRLSGEITDVLNYLYAAAENNSGNDFALARLRELAERLSAELGLSAVVIELPAEIGEQVVPLGMPALELMIREILENSLKFHPRHTPHIQISVQPQVDRVCLRFTDDGIHLAPQQLAHVWTPYHQGEKYFTGEVAGMGLGLPLVANLVWGVGGRTHIYNRSEQPGVVVEIELPLLPKSAAPGLFV
jgi:two-component system, cell cycle response regulator